LAAIGFLFAWPKRKLAQRTDFVLETVEIVAAMVSTAAALCCIIGLCAARKSSEVFALARRERAWISTDAQRLARAAGFDRLWA
jgi:2-keto-4-pentenoate hydratase